VWAVMRYAKVLVEEPLVSLPLLFLLPVGNHTRGCWKAWSRATRASEKRWAAMVCVCDVVVMEGKDRGASAGGGPDLGNLRYKY
jgi:hypothetical protein